jgi:aldehyde dehydrogenase (NAD+)
MREIEIARHAAAELRQTSVRERIIKIQFLKKVILNKREAIIDRIQQETGKSRSDALISEIFGILDHLTFLEKNGEKMLKDKKVSTPIALMGKKSRIYFEPMGVILIISPWNYPFYQAIVPITAAFLAGNAVIYKPSEYTPMDGLVEEVLLEATFQSDWVQIIYGDGKAGASLIDQKPDKIFFTGSERTGQKIMEHASTHLIPVELELGGKDPMIVFEDSNIKRAVAGAVWGGLTNLGQSCTSVERIYVQKSIYEDFKKELIKQVQAIKQETDQDGDADVGSMTTDFQLTIIKKQLEDAKNKKAEIISVHWDEESKLIPPAIIDNVSEGMEFMKDETFGPLLPILPFTTEDEVISLANNSPYGLSASVWSKDLKRADRVARAIVTGNVSINNVMLTEGNPALPFGGIKNSGFGRYKGETGLHNFCNVKSVLIDKDSSNIETNWFPYTRKKYELFSEMTVNLFSKGIGSFVKFLINGLKLESYSNKVGKEGRE